MDRICGGTHTAGWSDVARDLRDGRVRHSHPGVRSPWGWRPEPGPVSPSAPEQLPDGSHTSSLCQVISTTPASACGPLLSRPRCHDPVAMPALAAGEPGSGRLDEPAVDDVVHAGDVARPRGGQDGDQGGHL